MPEKALKTFPLYVTHIASLRVRHSYWCQKYLIPTDHILVFDWYFNLTNKSNLIGRLEYDLIIRYVDNLVVAYFFGPLCTDRLRHLQRWFSAAAYLYMVRSSGNHDGNGRALHWSPDIVNSGPWSPPHLYADKTRTTLKLTNSVASLQYRSSNISTCADDMAR